MHGIPSWSTFLVWPRKQATLDWKSKMLLKTIALPRAK